MTIGFIGLGQMGMPMALNLTKPQDDYILCDIRPERLLPFEARGLIVTGDATALAGADIIFLSLPDTEIVVSVMRDLMPRLRPGTIVADTSTIDYLATVEIAQACDGFGVEFVDAPVSGMQSRAEDATLTIMCGGRRPVFDQLEPLLGRMGNKVMFMGKSGCGQLAKLTNQLLFDINAAAIAEILPMAIKMGLDAETIGAVVNSGTGASYASQFFVPRILDGRFDAGYPMRAAYKDLVGAATLGATHGIPMPVLAAATATYQQALLQGLGGDDKGGMIKVFEKLLGVAFRRKGLGS
jgi:3-hydroxyisobutyrate dehydrogenase-like beta-hydroxyacid dehydrogenase